LGYISSWTDLRERKQDIRLAPEKFIPALEATK